VGNYSSKCKEELLKMAEGKKGTILLIAKEDCSHKESVQDGLYELDEVRKEDKGTIQ